MSEYLKNHEGLVLLISLIILIIAWAIYLKKPSKKDSS